MLRFKGWSDPRKKGRVGRTSKLPKETFFGESGFGEPSGKLCGFAWGGPRVAIYLSCSLHSVVRHKAVAIMVSYFSAVLQFVKESNYKGVV